jgi:hypothetical protein
LAIKDPERLPGLVEHSGSPGGSGADMATPARDGKLRANGLDGKTWTRYSISIWSDIRKTPEEAALNHPAMFPVELARRLIQIFTRENEGTVFDLFMGSGSVLVAAREMGKNAIGIELSEDCCNLAKSRLAQGGLFGTSTARVQVHRADARIRCCSCHPTPWTWSSPLHHTGTSCCASARETIRRPGTTGTRP